MRYSVTLPAFLILAFPALLPAEETQAEAIAAIRKLGGRVTVDETAPGKPVVAVDLEDINPNDIEVEPLQGVSRFRTLLLRCALITGVGMEKLKGLTKLQKLRLFGARITDDGLKNLSGMKDLQSLDLTYAHINGPGLVHLKGLAKLEDLDLAMTGIAEESLVNLKAMMGLKRLNLSGVDSITNKGLEHLRG